MGTFLLKGEEASEGRKRKERGASYEPSFVPVKAKEGPMSGARGGGVLKRKTGAGPLERKKEGRGFIDKKKLCSPHHKSHDKGSTGGRMGGRQQETTPADKT